MDDAAISAIRKDLSGGMNNRQHGSIIGDTQSTLLKNVDITVPGETRKRPGLTLAEDVSNTAPTEVFGFEPSNGTNQLCVIDGTNLRTYPGSGSFTTRKSDFVASTSLAKIVKAQEEGEGDIILIKVPGNNWFRMNQSFSFQDLGATAGTGSDSPIDSPVAVWFRNRLWILKDNLLYWSSAVPADFATAFDTPTDNYKMPVGKEQAIFALRDLGIIALGEDGVWAINPSTVPAATDKPEFLVEEGCIAGNTAAYSGDDLLYLAKDGVRGLFRTQQDKVQGGASYPLSYPLKDEFESLSWAYIEKSCAIYFDNKYFLSVPVDASTYNNEVWVYYPAFKAWMVITGWNVSAWSTMRVNGEERLFAADSTDGKVYRAWHGFSDNSTAIDYDEQGRKEDFGKPLVYKVGGEVKIRALSSGAYNLTIQVSIDDQDWATLGTMSLEGNAPSLPISLPFTLADTNIVEEVFHLDSLGKFRQLKLRIRHNDTNGSDEIKIYERDVITYAEEYQSE